MNLLHSIEGEISEFCLIELKLHPQSLSEVCIKPGRNLGQNCQDVTCFLDVKIALNAQNILPFHASFRVLQNDND